MIDTQKLNVKILHQSRNYILKSDFFGNNQFTNEDKREMEEKKHIPNIYN